MHKSYFRVDTGMVSVMTELQAGSVISAASTITLPGCIEVMLAAVIAIHVEVNPKIR